MLRAIAIALAALVLWVVLFTWHSKVEAERAQAIRDASYREALSRSARVTLNYRALRSNGRMDFCGSGLAITKPAKR